MMSKITLSTNLIPHNNRSPTQINNFMLYYKSVKVNHYVLGDGIKCMF